MPAEALTYEIHLEPFDQVQVERISAFLQGLPEGVHHNLLGRLSEFVCLRQLHDGPASAALGSPTSLGRLAWRIDILEEELIAAANAACRESSDRFHGSPPDAN